MTKILSCFLMLLFSVSLMAQNGYERIYRFSDQTEHLTVDGQQAADGGYVFLSLVTERDSTKYRSVNISKLTAKGDLEFSQDLVLEDSLELLPEGDLEFIPGDRMAITLTGVKDSLSHFVIVTNASAVPDWSRKYPIYQDSSDLDYYRPRIKASQELDLSMYQAGVGSDKDINQVYLSKIGIINGANVWSKYITKPGPDGSTKELDFGDVTTCLEGGVAVVGVDDESKEFFLSKVDADGNLEWNQSITTTLVSSNSIVNSITQLPDSSYVIVGSYFTQNIEFDGFVIKTDKTGIVSWSKRVDFDFSFNDVHLIDVVTSLDNGLLISAKQIGALDTAAIGIKLDFDGNVLWQSSFKEVSMEHVNLGGLSSANGNGMAFFCNGGNLIGQEQYTPYLIVTDSMGMTLCNDTIDVQIVFDAMFANDTLELEINDYLYTYDVDCCEDSFTLGDDRNNRPARIKMFDGFTYLSSVNIDATGENLASFSKIDENNQVVWTQEFEAGATIFDFEKINANEFMLVGYTEPLSTFVDNSSFIVKMDDDGNITGGGTMNNLGREILTQIIIHPNPINPLFPIYIGGYTNYSSAPSSIDQSIVFNIDEDFNINWINNYNLDLQDSQFSRVSSLENGNVIIYGDVKPSSNGIITELDGLNGSVISSRSTRDRNFFMEIEQLPNGNLVGVGGVLTGAEWNATIYLMNAEYEFISGINYENGDINFFREVEFDIDGTMYATGLGSDGSTMLNTFTIDGDIITPGDSKVLELNSNNTSYPYIDVNGSMMAYAAGGNSENGDSDVIIYNGDVNSSFFCFKERDIMAQSFVTVIDTVDVSFAIDSLPDFEMVAAVEIDFTNTDICEQEFFSPTMTLDVDNTPFGQHELATVALAVMPFCANEPLEWTFDAETIGATSYLWTNSDGEELGMADTLYVEEEGVYFVEVTMGVDVCYTLCDSAELAILEEPMISISVDTTGVCNQTFDLTVNPSALNETAIVSYMWDNATNDITQAISVTEEGNYMVTAVDDCGIEAVASFQVVFDEPTVNVGIVVNESSFCTDGTFTLIAMSDPLNTTSITSYLWSTGEITESISVSEAIEYSVVVTDECGSTAETSFTPTLPILVTGVTTGVESEGHCTDGIPYTLLAYYEPANATEETVLINWSTNDDVFSINVENPGDYAFTVTDFCQNEFPGIITVTEDDLFCPPEYDFPNVFIANYNDPAEMGYNDGFGVVIKSDSGFVQELDTYELSVYNRFGEKVFETTDYEEHWDGIYQDKDSPGGVYMYFAKVVFRNGVEETAKGDFTLIR